MSPRDAELLALFSVIPAPTLAEVGAKYGITKERVRQILKANGIVLGQTHTQRRCRLIREAVVAELRSNGLSGIKAQATLGVSYQTIHHAAREHGLPPLQGHHKPITLAGETHSRKTWGHLLKGSATTAVSQRIRRLGWSEAEAVSVPVRERTVTITLDGVTRSPRAWAALLGGSSTLVSQRLSQGWDERRACTQPVRQRKRIAVTSGGDCK